MTSVDQRRALDVAIDRAQVPAPIAKRIRSTFNATVVDTLIDKAIASYRISERLGCGDLRYEFEGWRVDIGTIEVV